MGGTRKGIVWLTSLLLMAGMAVAEAPAPAPAQPVEDAVAEIAQNVKQAIANGNGTELTEACKWAETLRPNCDTKQFEPVVREVAKGVKNKDTEIAAICVRTLGHLDCPGSSRHFVSLLSPPKNPKEARYQLHLTAIEAAGHLHDRKCVSRLEKLVQHANAEFAIAGTRALAEYEAADHKTRVGLVQRLVSPMSKLEKSRPKGAVASKELAQRQEVLRDCLRKLTKEPTIETSDDVRKWLRKEQRATKKA